MSREDAESTTGSLADAAQPQCSIIVPAYNESSRLGATLEQILDHVRRENWNA